MQSAVVFVALIAAASAHVLYQPQYQYGVVSPAVQQYTYSASPVAQSTSLVGPSGTVQNVQYKNGQQLTYQAQHVPVSQTYQSVYGVNGQVVRSSPVVASTYAVPATTYGSAINYGSVYGYPSVYGQQVIV